MSPLEIGLLIGVATLALLAMGMPIAFSLGAVSVASLLLFEGPASLSIVAETFFAGAAQFGLVAIPLFILMGTVVASSPAGRDLYDAFERWLYRVPGGLVLATIGACAVFSALSGSSPATAAAIGKMGIPEMRRRGVPDAIATGSIAAGGTLGILIPPSLTMIVYGIATETSISRLFIAGILPGLMLTALFMLWTWCAAYRHGDRLKTTLSFSLRDKLIVLPRVLPFLAIIVGILYALYGGVATPTEAAGVGALLCLILTALFYKIWRPGQLWRIFQESTRESVMILIIIAASELFSFTLSSLFITQSMAQWIVGLELNRWALMAIINGFLLIAGCFLPPVAIILMTAPVLFPLITSAGFDPYWFAVILTVNMEIGLITPPVGLNLFVINSIAPEVALPTILWGALPYMLLMVVSIVLLCLLPAIATWLPTYLMGPAALR